MNSLENAALLIHNGHPELAIPILDSALSSDPQSCELHTNIGIAFRMTNQFRLALLHQTLATQLKPDAAVAWHNLGVTRTEVGDFEEAFLAHQKAYECGGGMQISLGYAYALMRYARFDLAWQIWENSRHLSLAQGIVPWTGKESLQGKRILVMREGGFGDSILFLRWFPELQDRGAEVSFYAWDEMAPLFVGHPWISSVLTDEEAINPRPRNFDYCVSLMSLPALLNCRADSIPMAPRYIMANPEKSNDMYEKVRYWAGRKRVGICWGAEEGFIPKKARSIPDEQIEVLKDAPVDWISLWPGHQLPWMKYLPLNDWSDTAALVTHLDAVVSVDTAVMHLAGAMGKKTFAMCPIGADWKFFRGVSPSPWYASLEVITNDDPVKWTGAVQKALDGIRGLQCVPSRVNPEHGVGPSKSTG